MQLLMYENTILLLFIAISNVIFFIIFIYFIFFNIFFNLENPYTLANKKCAHRNTIGFHVRLHNTL